MNLYIRLVWLMMRLIGLPRRGVLEASRVVTWDEKYIYLEQRFESRGALCAHAFVKGLFLGRGARVDPGRVARGAGYTGAPPPMPEELRIWAELKEVKRQQTR